MPIYTARAFGRYRITATITRQAGPWGAEGIPTFTLDGGILGLESETQARIFAVRMLERIGGRGVTATADAVRED